MDQADRIRAMAYEKLAADPSGPNAPRLREILSSLPKVSKTRNAFGDESRQTTGGRKAVETAPNLPSGEDFGEELPPTPDEEAGLPNELDAPGIGTRALVTVADPTARRGFERGMDDMLTFGAGQKIAGKVGDIVGDPSFSAEQEAKDAAYSPNARGYGRIAGALTGKGAAGAVGKGSLAVTAPIANAGKGMLGNILLGGIRGGVANEMAMPVIAGGQAAVRGENPLPVMKEEATNPVNPIAGLLLGFGSGASRGIRESPGQTGRDIRLTEKYGATGSRIGRGPQGGVFETPEFRDIEGTAGEQGMASRRAAEKVMTGIADEGQALNRQYGASKAAARDQGFLEGLIDTGAIRQDAEKLISGMSLTTGERAAIRREVLDELDKHPSGMTVDDFNDFRGKLGRIFGVGPGETAVPAIDTLRQSAKRTVDETEMGPINEAYSKGRERISRQHEQLGISEGGRRDVAERRIANIIQRRANDEAPGTGIQEAGDLGTEQFLSENPRYRIPFDTARLLAAKERMTAGIEPGGGFFRRVGKHGLLEKNLEPALVGAYRLGAPMEKGSIPAALVAQLLLSGSVQ